MTTDTTHRLRAMRTPIARIPTVQRRRRGEQPSPLQDQVAEWLAKHGPGTAPEVGASLGCSVQSARQALVKLERRRAVARIGTRRIKSNIAIVYQLEAA